MKRTCPECSKVAEFCEIDSKFNRDLLGRTQYECGNCKANCIYSDDEMVFMGDNCEWENNLLQFARILAEIRGIGIGQKLQDSLVLETGLTLDQLYDLFERAQFVWETGKENNFNPQNARWAINTDNLNNWYVNDRFENVRIDLPEFPLEIGPRIARTLALALNSEPKTMGH